MPSTINFDNANQRFNIHLDAQGNLEFNANNVAGAGQTIMQVSDRNDGRVSMFGPLFLGGFGGNGSLQIKDSDGSNALFMGLGAGSVNAVIGGGSSNRSGNIQISNFQNQSTIVLQGSIGEVRAMSFTQTSDSQFQQDIAPLSNALDQVLAMQGVRYIFRHNTLSSGTSSDKTQIGFIGQEMEKVCPEVVSTDSDGYRAINYTRLVPILVEAIKEQQQLITQQTLALKEALAKVDRLEEKMQEQNAA